MQFYGSDQSVSWLAKETVFKKKKTLITNEMKVFKAVNAAELAKFVYLI